MCSVRQVSIFLFLLGMLCAPAQGKVPSSSACHEALDHLEHAVDSVELMGFKQRFASSKKADFNRLDDIDARRLINAEDWRKARQSLGGDARLFYSERTLRAWDQARKFIRNHPEAPLSADTLKQIHAVAMEGLHFNGYEGRRLRLRHARGELDKETLDRELTRAFTQDGNPSGTDHKTLPGQFRSDPIDEIHHGGSNFTADGTRYFDRPELEAARQHPQIRVDEKSVKKIGPGRFTADTYYTSPAKINGEVDKIFSQLNADLKKAKTDDQVVLAVARMQKELIIVHPFLDGNGRTVRLMTDLILERHGFPPPVLLREEEIVLSAEELAQDLKAGMRIYLDAKEASKPGGFR